MSLTHLPAYHARILALQAATGRSLAISLEVWYHVAGWDGVTPPPAVEWHVSSFGPDDRIHQEYAADLETALTATEHFHGLVATPVDAVAVVTP